MKLRGVTDRIDAENAGLAGSRFCDVDLSNAHFEDIRLSGAVFRDVDLTNVKIEDANLSGMMIGDVLVTDLIAAHATLIRSGSAA
jgi:uncharacterized protein YjbI with pentapeptide repeats